MYVSRLIFALASSVLKTPAMQYFLHFNLEYSSLNAFYDRTDGLKNGQDTDLHHR